MINKNVIIKVLKSVPSKSKKSSMKKIIDKKMYRNNFVKNHK